MRKQGKAGREKQGRCVVQTLSMNKKMHKNYVYFFFFTCKFNLRDKHPAYGRSNLELKRRTDGWQYWLYMSQVFMMYPAAYVWEKVMNFSND